MSQLYVAYKIFKIYIFLKIYLLAHVCYIYKDTEYI